MKIFGLKSINQTKGIITLVYFTDILKMIMVSSKKYSQNEQKQQSVLCLW